MTETQTNSTALALTNQQELWLEVLPKEIHGLVKATAHITKNDVLKVLKDFPTETKQRMAGLIKRLGPNSTVLDFGEDAQRIPVVDVRIKTGQSQSAPQEAMPGALYTSNGTVLPTPFKATIILVTKGRLKWPDDEAAERVPECKSLDRHTGSKYGSCATCDFKPWNAGKPTGCNDNVSMYLLDADYTGLYRVQFQKTSLSAGNKLAKAVEDSLERPWVSIGTSQQQKGSRSWHIYTGAVTGDVVDADTEELCQVLQQAVLSSEHIPALASIHQQAREEAEMSAAEGDGGGDAPPAYESMDM